MGGGGGGVGLVVGGRIVVVDSILIEVVSEGILDGLGWIRV